MAIKAQDNQENQWMRRQHHVIWPRNYRFALRLTHDIDETKKIYQYRTHSLKTFRSYRILSFFSKKEPYWNFERIMDLEQKYKVRSTFFPRSKKIKSSTPF